MRIKDLAFPAIVMTLVLGACGGSEPPPPPAPTGPTQAETDAARADSIARVQAEEARQMEAERREEERLSAARDEARSTLEDMVHFDYDESAITAEAEQILRRKIPILRSSPTVRLRLEGHADERGSTEYNLALGSRRAESISEFLSGFGIAADRLMTTSFGEERPLVNSTDETSWAQNRRVEFSITGGEVVVSEEDGSQQ
ncbi:MAG: OmpA family protein [Longimicrobiales bacterium]|nr:OmpA family protein [Longimicrobiales bacterium]